MANIYLNLPCPSANGAGAWVDVSSQGAEKTIVVGGDPRATINIEISNETGAPSGDGAPVASFLCMGAGGKRTIANAAKWMRCAVSDYKSGTPSVEVGSPDDGASFANLPATASNGTGASVDVSALGSPYTTVTVLGTYRGSVIIEVSEDNVSWGQSMVFTNAPRFQSKIVTAKYMRVRRAGVPTIAPGLPQVDVGKISDTTPSPVFSDPDLIRYTADGTEGTSLTVPLNFVRPTADYFVAFMSQSVVPQSAKIVTDIPSADRTVNDFVANLSAPAELGDEFEFLVVGG